ncbi:MAG: sigma-54-dependent transcriptional regulator [Calditrichaceae bacterium]
MRDEIIKLLIIEDEEFDVVRIKNTLKPFEQKINIMEIVSSGKAAIECLKNSDKSFDVIVMDYQISGGLYGDELIHELKKIEPTIQILVITKMTINQADLFFANQLISSGAFWFGTKYPGDIENYIYQPTDFVLSIMNAYEKKQMELEQIRSRKKLDHNIDQIMSRMKLIGNSAPMVELQEKIQKYAAPNATVLILGESGTGKELVARNLHHLSPRKYENFITVNCGAIPKELIESELFGFEKGSFTGAKEAKSGLFEQADKGTIFLDEITELPSSAQVKLLRVLQEGEIDKIGRKHVYHVDVRVIAATNKDIGALLEEKAFREDLYYRLNILRIKVPALRDRISDIPVLANHFLNMYSREMGIRIPKIDNEAMEILTGFHWPGNVRQLKNTMNRLVLLSTDVITKELIQSSIEMDDRGRGDLISMSGFSMNRIQPLKQVEVEFRRQYVEYVRNNCSTDAEAAEKLGFAPPNFHRICKELGLK